MRKLKVTELNRLTPEAFKESKKIPLIVVLDHIRSLNNVGSVFRTSDAFRVEAIYLCGITACPPNAEIHKTALGAEETVDWEYFKDTPEAVDKLRQEGYTVCAVEQAEGSVMLDNLQLDKTKKYAIVMGNEVKGVQQNVVDNCDICINTSIRYKAFLERIGYYRYRDLGFLQATIRLNHSQPIRRPVRSWHLYLSGRIPISDWLRTCLRRNSKSPHGNFPDRLSVNCNWIDYIPYRSV